MMPPRCAPFRSSPSRLRRPSASPPAAARESTWIPRPTSAAPSSSPSAARGCHTLEAAGALDPSTRVVRNQGPNLDERAESPEDVLYAIQNGGFSGAIMPQQIVTGEDAQAVADFVAKYAGGEDRPADPAWRG